MNIRDTRATAEELVKQMLPFCERVEIAGSIRRDKEEVKDIEICAIPIWTEVPDPDDLFGERFTRINLLWLNLSFRIDIVWIKTGTSELVPWKIKPEGKYWRGLLPGDIKLDLFLASRENFGAIYLIRTGSAEFTTAVVTHAKQIGKPCRGGFFTREGEPVATPEESDVFDLLNLEYVAPEKRIEGSVLRAKR